MLYAPRSTLNAIFATCPKKGGTFIIKVALKTLGCKVNQYETESIINFFQDKNFQIVNFNQNADIYIINTCTVTQKADRKSKQMIRKAIRLNRKSKIIVTGCYAQSNYEDLQRIKGVNLIAGNGEKNDILKQLEKIDFHDTVISCLLYTSPSPRDRQKSRMPSSA